MEANKEATSSSSLANELFGSKEPSSSSAVFDSMFPPPSKAHTRDYISSEETKKNYDSTAKGGSSNCLDSKDKSQNLMIDLSPYYEQQVSQPCSLSSSIHYGGQDVYPRTTKNAPGHSKKYNEGGEDIGMAARGNWWQGSFYY